MLYCYLFGNIATSQVEYTIMKWEICFQPINNEILQCKQIIDFPLSKFLSVFIFIFFRVTKPKNKTQHKSKG